MSFKFKRALSLIVSLSMLFSCVINNTVISFSEEIAGMEPGQFYNFTLNSDKGNAAIADDTGAKSITLLGKFSWHSMGGYNAINGELFQFAVGGTEGETYNNSEIKFNFFNNKADGTVEIYDSTDSEFANSLGSVTAVNGSADTAKLKFNAESGHSYVVKGTSANFSYFMATNLEIAISEAGSNGVDRGSLKENKTYTYDISKDIGGAELTDADGEGMITLLSYDSKFRYHTSGGYNASAGNENWFEFTVGGNKIHENSELKFIFLSGKSVSGAANLYDAEDTSYSNPLATLNLNNEKTENAVLTFNAEGGHTYVVRGLSTATYSWFLAKGLEIKIPEGKVVEVPTESTTDGETESTTDGETESTTDGETESTTDGETESTTDGETESTTDGETESTTDGPVEELKGLDPANSYTFDLGSDKGNSVPVEDSNGKAEIELMSKFTWHSIGGYNAVSGDWFKFSVTGTKAYTESKITFKFTRESSATGVAAIYDMADTNFENPLAEVTANKTPTAELIFDAQGGHSYIVKGTGAKDSDYSYFMVNQLVIDITEPSNELIQGNKYDINLGENKDGGEISDAEGIFKVQVDAGFAYDEANKAYKISAASQAATMFNFKVTKKGDKKYFKSKLALGVLENAVGTVGVYDSTDSAFANMLASLTLGTKSTVKEIEFDAEAGHTYVVRAEQGAEVSLDSVSFTLGADNYIDVYKNIRVGKSDKANYATITEALNAVKGAKTPVSEEDRITIEIEPGQYREQVMVTTPYVTLKKAADAQESDVVDVTWYFGIGYAYDNCGTNGFYDPNVDWSADATWNGLTKVNIGDYVSTVTYYDKQGQLHRDEKVEGGCLGKPKSWGCTIMVNANYVNLEGIYFNNSFNIYVCQEELDHHVTQENQTDKKPARKNLTVCTEATGETKVASFNPEKTDYTAEESAYLVRSTSFCERAAAIVTKGAYVKIKDCKFVSNQDTLGVDVGPTYFENCYLSGGTDYICGTATAVFNNCQLVSYGYSNDSKGATITAASTDAKTKYGYLFFNCTIDNKRESTAGTNLGRPWGGIGGPQTTYYNTTVIKPSSINAKPWASMGCDPNEARFIEYGSVDKDGNIIDLSGGIQNTFLPYGIGVDEWHILEYNPRNYLTKDWDPMNFGKNLEKVDAALDSVEINVPTGADTIVSLPTAPEGVEYFWESSSVNAIVNEDKTAMTIVRPGLSEPDIKTSVVLYAKDSSNNYGDKRVIEFNIAATTDTENVFNVPVTIKQSAENDKAVDYEVKFEKGGALIKSATITMPANEKSVSATIENIPADSTGIEYDVTISSNDDNYIVKTPVDGMTKVTGKVGENVELSVYAEKAIDDKVNAGEDYKTNGTTTFKAYDLIAKAIENGADEDSLKNSDIVEVYYDVVVKARPNVNAYIDIVAAEPKASATTGSLNSRFLLTKLNQSWQQIDTVDCSQGFSGSSNGGGQYLNLTGKFKYADEISHIKTIINYKTKTVSVTAWGGSNNINEADAKVYSFESFPTSFEKGKLYLAVYPENANNDFTVSNINVSYKKVISGEEPPVVEDVLGDVSGDGTVDFNDAAIVLKYVLNPDDSELNMEEIKIENAKVTQLNHITSYEASLILQKALNSEFKFPVDK